MSGSRYSLIPADAIYDKHLTETALMVLLILGSEIDQLGWQGLVVKKYADRLNVSIQDIQTGIDLLQSRSYIRMSGAIGEIASVRVNLDVPLRCAQGEVRP